MLFNSFEFFILLIITFFIYYLPVFKKLQVATLVTASFVFYAYHNPSLLLLFITSLLLNAFASYYVIHSNDLQNRKIVAALGVVLNLALLAFFKYASFIINNLFDTTTSADPMLRFLISIPLPIGISFYTFEGISLLVDVFRDRKILKTDTRSLPGHLLQTGFFISFFPHLIAGPILKAHDFYPQISQKRFSDIPWNEAIKTLIMGYFLKMVVADNMKDATFMITYPYFEGLSSCNLLLLLFAYSMQIFADFAGYSLIAIGLGYLFGYNLPENFNFPYISKSFAEFWSRWHISLSTWLKQYLYIPLGGNRKGETRTYVNLFLVMLLGGLWHGAGWSYMIWGGTHGLALGVERFFTYKIKIKRTQLTTCLQTLFTFVCVTFLWLLFKLPEFSQVVHFYESLFENFSIPFQFKGQQLKVVLFCLPVVLYHLQYLLKKERGALLYAFIGRLQPYVYALLLFLILVNSGSQGEFIYFQF